MEKRIEQLIHCTTGDITSRSKKLNCNNLHPIQNRERERERERKKTFEVGYRMSSDCHNQYTIDTVVPLETDNQKCK